MLTVAIPNWWIWEPVEEPAFNLAPPSPPSTGGAPGYSIGPVSVPALTETELFALKCVSFSAQFAANYANGRNTNVLTGLVHDDGQFVHGVLTHEISQSPEDIQYTGSVDADGCLHLSCISTAPATVRGSITYVSE